MSELHLIRNEGMTSYIILLHEFDVPKPAETFVP